MAFDPKVVAHTETQAEFVKPIWEYLASAVSARRVEQGQGIAQDYASWLSKAQTKFGVDPSVIVGIWGLETDFWRLFRLGLCDSGRSPPSPSSITAGDLFRDEAAGGAADSGGRRDIAPSQMKGSWAGAMGQTQFMPSSFQRIRRRFRRRGAPRHLDEQAGRHRLDRQLSRKNTAGSPTSPGVSRVVLPDGFGLQDAGLFAIRAVQHFQGSGRQARRRRCDCPAPARRKLLIVAGLKAPIFLVTPNFKVIKSYNNSTSYALGVALLGDRAMGGGDLQAAWPVHDRQLNEAQMREMQTRLKENGL